MKWIDCAGLDISSPAWGVCCMDQGLGQDVQTRLEGHRLYHLATIKKNVNYWFETWCWWQQWCGSDASGRCDDVTKRIKRTSPHGKNVAVCGLEISSHKPIPCQHSLSLALFLKIFQLCHSFFYLFYSPPPAFKFLFIIYWGRPISLT